MTWHWFDRHLELRTWGERISDRLVSRMSSWPFILGQTFIIICWMMANVIYFFGIPHWDKYPFILLNLGLSLQAAYTGPIVLMSGSRQEARDRAKADADHASITAIRSDLEDVKDALYQIRQRQTAP